MLKGDKYCHINTFNKESNRITLLTLPQNEFIKYQQNSFKSFIVITFMQERSKASTFKQISSKISKVKFTKYNKIWRAQLVYQAQLFINYWNEEIFCISSSRADYNHLFVLMKKLQASKKLKLSVIITVHTLKEYGNT